MKPISELVQRTPLALMMAASLSLLTACNSDNNNSTTEPATITLEACTGDSIYSANGTAIIAGAASDYSSGGIAMLDEETLTLNENVLVAGSDIAVGSNGDHYYLLERFGANSLSKIALDDPSNPIWNYSTEGDDTGSNPHSVVFASEEKAYLLRYGTDTAWVINPSASDEATFKTADLDLSAYDPGDGSVEMTQGLILDGKLFVLMQRLDADSVPQEAYVAVIDTANDSQIATGAGGDLSGVLLPVRNPNAMVYNEADGLVYIQGTGRYASFDGSRPAELTGGIATLNPTTYETNLLIDDGDDVTDMPFGGQISNMAIVDANNGYFVSYAAWGDNSLYHFNPSTGNTAAITGFANVDIRSLAGRNGALWVGTAAGTNGSATLSIVNAAEQCMNDTVSLSLTPIGLAFANN